MGCDIHLRVEYLAPRETLDQALRVVPEGPPEWVPAEKLTPKAESSLAQWHIDDPKGLAEQPAFHLEHWDRWYYGRDYALFGALAGVRDHKLLVWEDRGLPDDVSDHVHEDYESWGFDAHTPSWQTLDELLAVDWDKHVWPGRQGPGNPRWAELLERLRDLAFIKCQGDQTRVRIVYWFDN